MLFWMDTETFVLKFLQKEDDFDILESYYVLVSYKARIGKHKETTSGTLQNATDVLYPNSGVLFQDGKDYRSVYWRQLESDGLEFLAYVIDKSIRDGYNVVFLCTPVERKKQHYLEYLAQFVNQRFGYPMYYYPDYKDKSKALYKYDVQKTLDICAEIIKKAKEKQEKYERTTIRGKRERRIRIESYSKKKLKKELKKIGYVITDESRSEMIDILINS